MHLGVKEVIRRVRSHSGSRSRSSSIASSNGSRGSRCSTNINIVNHGEIKILVMGGHDVGKTTICKKYAGLEEGEDDLCLHDHEIPYDASTFIDGDDGEIQQYDLEIYDYDPKASPIKNRKLIDKCDAFLLVYSKTSKQSLLKLLEMKQDISHIKGVGSNPIMFAVGNKSDLMSDSERVIQDDDLWSLNMDQIDVSAKLNEGIQTAFKALTNECAKRKSKEKRLSQ